MFPSKAKLFANLKTKCMASSHLIRKITNNRAESSCIIQVLHVEHNNINHQYLQSFDETFSYLEPDFN